MSRRTALRAAAWLAGALLLLCVVLIANTLRQGSRQRAVPAQPPAQVDRDGAAQHLAEAVRFRTVSYDDRPDASAEAFTALHAWLAERYPRAHAALKRERVGGHALLYTWPGRDAAAKPLMLMAHQDVVPIAPGTEASWQQPPFAGAIEGGFVWGRGAWDDKGNLVAIMEAVEALAREGFQPRRTVYLAFGHDEETGGEQGAARIAALLRERGVRLDFVLDEGLLITEGILKGLDAPLALIGIAEKGYANLAVTAHGTPGHGSMPPRETAIGSLAQALIALDAQPMPAGIRGVAAEMFATIAPEMAFGPRLLLSNLWLFGPLVRAQLEQGPSTNAMLRTTIAPTVLAAGEKVNALPGEAQARLNVRLLPGDRLDDVIAHARRAIGRPSVQVAPAGGAHSEASPVASSDAAGYRLIESTVRGLFPGTVVAPGLMIGGTDSRHLLPIADHVYRFSPVRARAEDLPRFHGTNERIAVDNLAELVAFYDRLLRADAQEGSSR